MTSTASYFADIDPAILAGLSRGADALQTRLGTVPARELVEEVTNGMWIEPTAERQTHPVGWAATTRSGVAVCSVWRNPESKTRNGDA